MTTSPTNLATHAGRSQRVTWLWLALPLGWLWWHLIRHLQVEWTLNPQYGYGWAVPFLCAYLISRKLGSANASEATGPAAATGRNKMAFAGLVGLAMLYAPTRLIEEANPEWRLISWALAGETVGLTGLVIYLWLGGRWLRRLAFPVAYFLVAVPWPTWLEVTVIQSLTRADAALTVELLNGLGIPAIPHGNVIEVATGEVGIDEACSGIRSFQATLMIALFLGELYQLGRGRRLGLVLAGFTLSFGFNLARMTVLVWVAARQGTGAIAQWHDPTGVTILLACFFTLWGLGNWLARGQSVAAAPARPESGNGWPEVNGRCNPWLIGLTVWLIGAESAVEGWYRWHEQRLPTAAQWTVTWPTNEPSFQLTALPERTRQLLRYDDGQRVGWTADGRNWQAIFLHWQPGRTAVHLVQNHTPEVCMTAAGQKVTTLAPRTWLTAAGLELPFTLYTLEHTEPPVYIFYCLWDDRTSAQGRDTLYLNYGTRLGPVAQGLRNPGQRSLEIALRGDLDAGQAQAIVEQQLQRLIHREPTSPVPRSAP